MDNLYATLPAEREHYSNIVDAIQQAQHEADVGGTVVYVVAVLLEVKPTIPAEMTEGKWLPLEEFSTTARL